MSYGNDSVTFLNGVNANLFISALTNFSSGMTKEWFLFIKSSN